MSGLDLSASSLKFIVFYGIMAKGAINRKPFKKSFDEIDSLKHKHGFKAIET